MIKGVDSTQLTEEPDWIQEAILSNLPVTPEFTGDDCVKENGLFN